MEHIKKLALLLAMAFALAGVAACEEEGPLERAGEKTDNAMEDVGDEIDDAADEVGDGLEDAADEVDDAVND